MKYCEKCGAKLNEGAAFCPNCGAKVESSVSASDTKQGASSVEQQMASQMNSANESTSTDKPWLQKTYAEKHATQKGLWGWEILAFLIPIVGWICYFVWRNSHPNRAHWMAISAWIGFAVNVLVMLTRSM